MKKIKSYFITFICIISVQLVAQDKTIDSLKNALKNARHDTIKCVILSQLTEIAPDGEWEKYNEALKNLGEQKQNINFPKIEKNIYLKGLALAYNNKGVIYNREGKNEESMVFYNKSLKISEAINDVKSIGTCLSNIGMIYQMNGDVLNALSYHQKSLKIHEEINYKHGIASSLNNIGGIYNSQGDYAESIKYLKKSLLISKQLNEQADIANTLNNIATNYISLGNVSEALIYCNQSYNISATLNNNVTMGNSLDNIASIYGKKGDKNTALIYYQKSLKIREVVNDKVGTARSFQNICGIYIGQNNYSKALILANKSLQYGKELNYPEIIRDVSILLTKIYKSTNQPKLALQNYELYIKMRDSISNQENRKASIKSQLKYEYEKKATADSVRVSEEKKLSTIKLKQEKTQRYYLYGGLGLTVLFGIFMFSRFRITQKQKNVIEEQKLIVENQKHIVDEKQKEILDSIHYAKRIQLSLVPTEKFIDRVLKKKI